MTDDAPARAGKRASVRPAKTVGFEKLARSRSELGSRAMRVLPLLLAVSLVVVATIAGWVSALEIADGPKATPARSTSDERPADPSLDELLASADPERAARVEAPVSRMSAASRRAARASDQGKAVLRGRVDLGGVRESRGLWARLRDPRSRAVVSDAASLHQLLRSREKHPEFVPVKACRFELVAPREPRVVEIFALGAAEPVFVSPPLEAIAGSDDVHPELDGIDLRGRVHLVSFQAFDAATRSEVGGAIAYAPGSFPLDAGKRYAAAATEIEAMVEAPGYLATRALVNRESATAWLPKAPEIELVLDPSLQTPPDGARVELELRLVRRADERFASGGSGVEASRLVLDGRGARFRLCVEGEYEVRFHSRYTSREKQSAAAFAGESTLLLTRELAGAPVVVAPLAPAYSTWIASLR
jgi:hypothetical protein